MQWFARWSRPGTNCSVEPGGTNRAGDHSGTTAALKGNLNPSRHIWKTLNRMAEESRAGQSTLIIVPNQLWSSPTLDPPESVSANWQNQAINFQITTSCTWGGRAWKASAGLNMSEMHFMISPRCGERGGRHSINACKTKKVISQLSSDFYWNQCKEIFGWSGFALLTVVGFIFSWGLQMPLLGFEDLFPSKWSWLLITRNTTHAQDLWRKNFSVDSSLQFFIGTICPVQLLLNWTFAWRYNVMTIKLKNCCRHSIERSRSPMRSLSGVFCELETLTWAWERHWSNVGQQ